MWEAWNIHDFQACQSGSVPRMLSFCGMVLHRYKNANSLF